MPFSADVSTLQGHKELTLSELLHNSYGFWCHGHLSAHICTTHTSIYSLTYCFSMFSIDFTARGHFSYELGRFESHQESDQECSRLLLQNNAHSTWPLTFIRDFPAKRGWSAQIAGNRPVSNPVPCLISMRKHALLCSDTNNLAALPCMLSIPHPLYDSINILRVIKLFYVTASLCMFWQAYISTIKLVLALNWSRYITWKSDSVS